MATVPAAKVIRDIRYYESDQPNVAELSLPGEPGRIFDFAVDVTAVGQRIARKLRERGFVAGPFDHVYVNFTPLLPDHVVRWSDRKVEPWLRYVDYGLSPAVVAELPAGAREALVAEATFRALEALVASEPDEMATLAKVRDEIAQRGSEIEILLLTKTTRHHRITISYQIRPHDRDSVGWIEYEDLRTKEHAKAPFVRLVFYEDIYPLVGAVVVSGDTITLRPRTSSKADLHNERYAPPIEVSIPTLLSGVPLLPRPWPVLAAEGRQYRRRILAIKARSSNPKGPIQAIPVVAEKPYLGWAIPAPGARRRAVKPRR